MVDRTAVAFQRLGYDSQFHLSLRLATLQRDSSTAWPNIAYSAITFVLSPLARAILRHRLARGKEDPERWQERLGIAGLPRPSGKLIWMHAVSVGELLALRGLVAELSAHAPSVVFLLTSVSRASSAAIARHMPERSVHQFLPLDLPGSRQRFLDHWKPDLVVWAEQDLWPGLAAEATRRGIPQAFVNVRMNSSAFRRRRFTRALWRGLYQSFELIAAQDKASAKHMEALGAPVPVRVTGSLKPSAPPLSDNTATRASLQKALTGRPVWVAASTHAADERTAMAAQKAVLAVQPDSLIIVAPRHPGRGKGVEDAARAQGLRAVRRTTCPCPAPETEVYIADTIGELGLWYRIADVALIGGSFSANVEGHNPWEPVRLGCAVLHGPHVANFRDDYAALADAAGTREVGDAKELATAVLSDGLADMAGRASVVADIQASRIQVLASDIVSLLKTSNASLAPP